MSEPSAPRSRLCDFPPTSRDAWSEAAARELAGAPLERLATRSRDGIAVAPLYTVDLRSADPGLDAPPGAPPFVRGVRPASAGAGWRIRQPIDEASATAAAASARRALAAGADSLWIRLDEGAQRGRTGDAGVRPGVALRDARDLDALLAGVDLTCAPVFEVGAAGLPVAASVLDRARALGLDLGALEFTVGGDPLGALALGGLGVDLERALDDLAVVVRELADAAPRARSVIASSIAFADAGASPALELALLLAVGVEYLQRLGARGLPVDRVAPRILLAMSVGRDVFGELAKLRAARLLWSRLVAALGGDAAAQAPALHVEGSWRELTRFDPWVNLLRGTTAAVVGVVGGAESVATHPFSAALGVDEDAERWAVNTQLLLREESHLDRVIDPAGGSWYVDALTDRLARAAWERFCGLARAGGLVAVLRSGAIQAEIAAQARVQGDAIATVREPITGVSRFAILDEAVPPHRPPTPADPQDMSAGTGPGVPGGTDPLADGRAHEGALAAAAAALRAGASITALVGADAGAGESVAPLARARLAAGFEALRGATPLRARLVAVGDLAAQKPRIDFVRALLASGGVALVGESPDASVDAALAAFAADPTAAAVICGADGDYPALVPALAGRLRSAGASVLLLAGRPKDQVEALRGAGVDIFLHLGCDVLATLGELRGRLAAAGEEPKP